MPKPRIFIGSSVEGARLAGALQINLDYATRCKVWHQAFPLSKFTMDALMDNCLLHEYAVFLFSPDDMATIRAQELAVARDNVLFEAGLFMGVQGKSRVFIVTPQDMPQFHLPTDLSGVETARYDPVWAKAEPNAALGAVATRIVQAIELVIQGEPQLDISTYPSFKEDATYPLKLNIMVRNRNAVAVVVKSRQFEFSSGAPVAPNAPLKDGIYRPKFRGGKDSAGQDIYTSSQILEPYKEAELWVPFDPTMQLNELRAKRSTLETGVWQYCCIWLEKQTLRKSYEKKL